jgi:hypothetical protein
VCGCAVNGIFVVVGSCFFVFCFLSGWALLCVNSGDVGMKMWNVGVVEEVGRWKRCSATHHAYAA